MVYISLLWADREWTNVSFFRFQILMVMSSEQEAKRSPLGSHLIAFTSFECPIIELAEKLKQFYQQKN